MANISVTTLKKIFNINKKEMIDKIKNNLLSFEEEIKEKYKQIKEYMESYKLLEDYKESLIKSITNNDLASFTLIENKKSYQYVFNIPFNTEIDNSLVFTLLFEQLMSIYNNMNYSQLIDMINEQFGIYDKTISFVFDPNKKDIFLVARLELNKGYLFDIIDSTCKKIKENL